MIDTMSYRLVAVDLGSAFAACARFSGENLLWAKTWKLRSKKSEHPGAKWERFWNLLQALEPPSYVAYEKVQAHTSSGVKCQKCGTIKSTIGAGRSLKCAKCKSRAKLIQRMNVDAAHAYGAGEALLLAWSYRLAVVPLEIHTSAVKLAAVGKGGGFGTAKADVLAAARSRWPAVEFETHDAADAAFVGLAALYDLGWAPRPGASMDLFPGDSR